MRTAFLSDLHLSPDRPDIQARFADFVGQVARYDAVYILGDLFEFWLGDDCTDLVGHQATEDLLRLASAARPVYLMHGNRDFLIGSRFAKRTGCTLIGEPIVVRLAGTDVLLMHGDSLCTDDVEHQAFRGEVRTANWQDRFLALPAADRLEQALRMRRHSEAGKRTKRQAIMDVNDEAVTRAMEAAGVRLLIHGHTHRPAIHRWRHRGRIHARIVLGDWFDRASVLEVDDSGILRLGPDLGELDLDDLRDGNRDRSQTAG